MDLQRNRNARYGFADVLRRCINAPFNTYGPCRADLTVPVRDRLQQIEGSPKAAVATGESFALTANGFAPDVEVEIVVDWGTPGAASLGTARTETRRCPSP